MTLYEIDSEIVSINEKIEQYAMDNDGLIPPDLDEILDDLQMDREKKIGNIVRLMKNVKAEQEAVETEVKRLQQKDISLRHKVESIKKFLAYAVGEGNKFKDTVCSIYWKESSSTIVEDATKLPVEFQKVTIEPKKKELKEAIERGLNFEGVTIETKQSMVVR